MRPPGCSLTVMDEPSVLMHHAVGAEVPPARNAMSHSWSMPVLRGPADYGPAVHGSTYNGPSAIMQKEINVPPIQFLEGMVEIPQHMTKRSLTPSTFRTPRPSARLRLAATQALEAISSA